MAQCETFLVAGAIVWTRQIENHLLTDLKHVEDALGNSWELHAEGQHLQVESVTFVREFDTRPFLTLASGCQPTKNACQWRTVRDRHVA